MTSARRTLLVLAVAAAAMGAAAKQERPQGWYALVDTTLGPFTIRLYPEQAPQTVAHFAAFAQGKMEWIDITTGNMKKGPFYDGLKIHRVTNGQRFEAGDPTGTSHGAPLEYVPKEPGPIDFSKPYRVGMTGSSLQRISGVLFFVTVDAEAYLNTAHNCFGEVIEGQEVVDAICRVKTDKNRVPETPVTINHITIVKSGNPPPIPEPVHYSPPRPVPTPRPADAP